MYVIKNIKYLCLYKSNSKYYYSLDEGLKIKFLKKPFENIKTVKFEDTNFNVPSDYHTNLIELYGDYMKLPPEEERIGHGKVYLSFGDDKDENKR